MKKIVKRWSDPQRTRPAGQCGCCGGELYPGMLCWHMGGMTLCDSCFVPWIRGELAACRLPVEEVNR